ncbi:MAG: hypothetical protein RMZ41_023885 [Nostoc sp. DedVER02]|nr:MULTISPECIES: hypothetical protein [unclassified Nostoc]MDZ7990544.1 hypothetical protein [Nostoc sp. DedVER02]MDZ8113902.1 hypothetical protein [Nostoc sp. DedVER01b]
MRLNNADRGNKSQQVCYSAIAINLCLTADDMIAIALFSLRVQKALLQKV